MKKFVYLVAICLLSFTQFTKAQCTGADLDNSVYTGDYYIYDITPDVLGFSSFNYQENPTPVTLFAEFTDASQAQPGEVLPVNYRSFDAVYLPDAEVGQPAATFSLEFIPGSCEVTFNSTGVLDNDTNLTCGSTLQFGPGSGGAYNEVDDTNFSVVFTSNINNDCGESAMAVELFFSREFLNAADFIADGFEHYIDGENRLFIHSKNDPIKKVSIYDLSGKKITQASFNDTRINLQLNGFASGIYLAQINTQTGKATLKFILR